jgi:hypothetical protein
MNGFSVDMSETMYSNLRLFQPQRKLICLTRNNFHTYTVHLDIIKVFYSPTDAQLNCLENNFKIDIKVDIKTAPTCFGAITIIPDNGDCTETCWSCFNINFNVNFKIVFKTIHLCIGC